METYSCRINLKHIYSLIKSQMSVYFGVKEISQYIMTPPFSLPSTHISCLTTEIQGNGKFSAFNFNELWNLFTHAHTQIWTHKFHFNEIKALKKTSIFTFKSFCIKKIKYTEKKCWDISFWLVCACWFSGTVQDAKQEMPVLSYT